MRLIAFCFVVLPLLGQIQEYTIKQVEHFWDKDGNEVEFARGLGFIIKARRVDGAYVEATRYVRNISLPTGRVPGEGTSIRTYDLVKAKTTLYRSKDNVLGSVPLLYGAVANDCRRFGNDSADKFVGFETLKGVRVAHFKAEEDQKERDHYVWIDGGCVTVQSEVRLKRSVNPAVRWAMQLEFVSIGNPDPALFDTRDYEELDPEAACVKNEVRVYNAAPEQIANIRRNCVQVGNQSEEYQKFGPASQPGAALQER